MLDKCRERGKRWLLISHGKEPNEASWNGIPPTFIESKRPYWSLQQPHSLYRLQGNVSLVPKPGRPLNVFGGFWGTVWGLVHYEVLYSTRESGTVLHNPASQG